MGFIGAFFAFEFHFGRMCYEVTLSLKKKDKENKFKNLKTPNLYFYFFYYISIAYI